MIRVFTAFSGYDSQCMALDRLAARHDDFSYELVGWSEIDKYAIQAHNALYPQAKDRNYGDISKIDWSQVPDFDLFTYSFPCQSISNAGLQHGFKEGSGTRSSLLWECKKAIEAKKPKYLLMENVKALVQQKFMGDFKTWLNWLASKGYSNYWTVMNAKDYGVPQNRERVFCVSILGDHDLYSFPLKHDECGCIDDIAEKEVDDRFYVSEKTVEGFKLHNVAHEAKGTGFK